MELDPENVIFVGDLAKFCCERDLRELISQFGHVDSVRVVRGYEKISLNYGFIAMQSKEEAVNAIKHLNGVFFMGRYIKVAQACKSDINKKKEAAVINSVFVRFSCQSKSSDISEIRFRSIFENFGYVEDVSLKIVRTDKASFTKHGYAFIHFKSTKEGTDSAIAALINLSNVLCEDLHLICEPSKKLLKQISIYYQSPPCCDEFYIY